MKPVRFSVLSQIGLLLAMGVGGLCGWLNFGWMNTSAHVISSLFIQLLQLISLPIIFFAILATITNLSGLDELKVLGRRVLQYTLMTTLIAGSVAAGLFVLLGLGIPVSGALDSGLPAAPVPEGHYMEFALKMIPDNAIGAFIDGNVIGIAFMAFLISIAILQLPTSDREPLQTFFKALFQALLKMTQMILKLLPLAIWAFMLILFQELSVSEPSSKLLGYALAVVGANLVQGIVVLPLFLRYKGIPVVKSFKGMLPAITMAFFTKSTNTALPLTLECAEKRLNVSPKVAQTAIPLCSVINMNGCAAFIYITVLFVAAQNGVYFSAGEMIGWIFIATLAAIGNAGVPMGCYFLTSAFLISLGVELTWLALILPLYAFFDMIETALNVWSDSCVTLVVDKELALLPGAPRDNGHPSNKTA